MGTNRSAAAKGNGGGGKAAAKAPKVPAVKARPRVEGVEPDPTDVAAMVKARAGEVRDILLAAAEGRERPIIPGEPVREAMLRAEVAATFGPEAVATLVHDRGHSRNVDDPWLALVVEASELDETRLRRVPTVRDAAEAVATALMAVEGKTPRRPTTELIALRRYLVALSAYLQRMASGFYYGDDAPVGE